MATDLELMKKARAFKPEFYQTKKAVTMLDQVRVYFTDDECVIYVEQDEDIDDAIVEMCENNDWSLHEVMSYHIKGQVEANDILI